MEVVTIESKAFQELVAKLDEIREKISWNDREKPFTETWLTNEEVCKILKVSKRSLQKYRDEGKIAFSQDNRSSKIYYRASDVEAYLKGNYNPKF